MYTYILYHRQSTVEVSNLKKNKYLSQQIAKKFNNKHRSNNYFSLRSSQKNKLKRTLSICAPENTKQENISKYKFAKHRRSQQCQTRSYSKTLTNEASNKIEYIHCTKSKHYDTLKQQLKMLLLRKSLKKYQYKSSGRRQSKQRHTPQATETNITLPTHNNFAIIQKPADFDKLESIKSALNVKCKIIYTHNNKQDDIKPHSLYKVMKCEVMIFDKYARSYWTSFELIPCSKERNNSYPGSKLHKIRDDLIIKIDNKTDKTEDNNHTFYYIAQYCYECRTPYIEYECEINESLKKPVWKLGDEHISNKWNNKFIVNYSIKDILQSNVTLRCYWNISLSDDVISILCALIGYDNIGVTTMDGICQYDINDRCNYIRHELAMMKTYKPPYVHHNNIIDENGELLQCKQVQRRLRFRKSNGIQNWYYKQWTNIPCSFHSALYDDVVYIDEDKGNLCHNENWPIYENKHKIDCNTSHQQLDWKVFGYHWWEF